MSEVACFGEPLVGFYAKQDIIEELPSFTMVIGGDTSNVALGVAKLGHPTMYITKLGDDIFGKQIWKTWKEASVDTSYVFIDDSHQTGVYFTLFDSDKKHHFVYIRRDSAAANFSVKDAETVSLKNIKIFHLSGISQAISRHGLESSFYFMRKCKQMGITISYDVNYRSALWSQELFKSVAWFTIKHFAYLVTLSLDEARELGLRGNPKEIAKKLIRKGPKIVAVKLGNEGCVVSSLEGTEYLKAFDVPVVDTVGAGDAFTAAMIVGILEHMNLKHMAYFANAVASLVCKSVGSTSSQPTRKEVKNFMGVKKHT